MSNFKWHNYKKITEKVIMSKDSRDQRVTVLFTESEVKEIDTFSKTAEIATRGEAIRTLIQQGLQFNEAAPSLMKRCEAAHDEGKSIGWILANILENHPKYYGISITAYNTDISLNDGSIIKYRKSDNQWSYHINEENTPPL